MVTVTPLSLVLTGLPFFNQVKFTDIVEESTVHSSDWLVPAMKGEPILFSDMLTLGAVEAMQKMNIKVQLKLVEIFSQFTLYYQQCASTSVATQ